MSMAMIKVKSTEKGIFIPHELIDLPAGTEFSIRKGKYYFTLEPLGLTNKTAGLVKIGEIDIDEEIGRMVESKVVG